MLYHHNDDLTPFTAQARERCATEFKGMSKNSVIKINILMKYFKN